MGSKINTSYWGANVNPDIYDSHTMSYGTSTNNIRNLIANGVYNPNTDSFDFSVSPWGIGYSAAGNRGQIVILRNGSRDGSAPGTITKIMFDGMDKENSNRPFALIDKNHYFRDSFRWLQSRVGGDITVDNQNYMKNAAVAYGSEYLSENSTTNGCLSLARVATYLDYQKYKLRVTGFIYINLDTGILRGFNFRNANETPEQAKIRFNNFTFPEHMAIVGIKVNMVGYAAYEGSPTSWFDLVDIGADGNVIQLRGHSIGSCINFNQITPTADDETKFKLCFTWNLGVYNNFYDEDSYSVSPYDYWENPPYVQNIPVEGENYRTGVQPTYNRVQVNGLGFSVDDHYRNTNIAGNFCDKEQNFSDITYKQRPLLYKINNNVMSEVKEGTALTQRTQQFRITSIYEVVGSNTFTKAQILSLIKHEVAFYGFQFYIAWGNAGGGTWSIGDDDLYLPKFDEHLITTGLYTSGAASLSEINATWGNVFDDSIPDYDVEYNPSPTPQGDDEKDGGKLNNNDYRGINLTGSNKFYALDETELNNFINFINGMYTSDTDDTQLKVDFKGSNPNDYIVSVSAYPFSLPFVGTSDNIPIGPISSTVAANRVEKQSIGVYSFGTIAIPQYYGDFRDFAPYTQIELYVPLAGTVSLDAAYYVGHSVRVEGVFDINTGSLSTKIIRISSDTGDETIDRVIDTSIAVQIPVTSRNMGDYQNNLHQMRMNLINSAVSGVTQSTGIITGGAAQAAQGVTSGNPLAGLSTSSMDIFGTTFKASQSVGNAYYALKHAQPAVAITSTASAANAFNMYNKAILFIKRAKMLSGFDAEKYGKTIGYACLKNTTIGDVSGFTVCSDIDLSGIPATADEINAIKSAFESGVYV